MFDDGYMFEEQFRSMRARLKNVNLKDLIPERFARD